MQSISNSCWLYLNYLSIYFSFHLSSHHPSPAYHYLPSGLVIFHQTLCKHYVVQWLSCVWLFVTPWTVEHQASLSFIISKSLLKLMYIHELVMSSYHLILCRPLPPLSSVIPSIRVFSNELALRIRWPKYWSFSFSISPSNNIQDWFPSAPQFKSINSLALSLLYGPTLISIYCWKTTVSRLLEKPQFPDYRKNHSFDYTDLLSAKRCLWFLIHCLGLS